MNVQTDPAPLSDGAKALRLLLAQASWTHRRVEALSFLAKGETRRAISWDFTLPPRLAIEAPGERVAIPIATLRKGPLKRFDVRDAHGSALSVWGTGENGRLAVEILVSALEGVRGHPVAAQQRDDIHAVVFAAADAEDAELARVLALLHDAARAPTDLTTPTGAVEVADPTISDALLVFDSLASTFARAFVLVVEVPAETVSAPCIVKAGYEDDRAKRSPQVNLTGRTIVEIEADGWANATSWHLEVQAPQGLRVARLRHETWDPDTDDLTSHSEDGDGASTAHVTATGVSPYDQFSCDVQFVPDRSALLNQVTLGAGLATVLLAFSLFARDQIADKLLQFGASGAPLGAVVFGLPALFFALVSRSGEHELVSKVLLGVRLASLGCAMSLWVAGVAIVWSPERDHLAVALGVTAAVNAAMLAWLVGMRFAGRFDMRFAGTDA